MKRMLDTTIRIGIVLLLAIWCFMILKPFVTPVVWAAIMAIAIYPLYTRLVGVMGGRKKLAAALMATVALALIIVPTVLLGTSLFESSQTLLATWGDGTIRVPPPNEGVAEWPVFGKILHKYWVLASENLEEALRQVAPQLKAIGAWLLETIGGTGLGILQFVISILIAAVFLASAGALHRAARAVFARIAGEQGDELAQISIDTVRSVAQGVLGVAIIQSLLAGVGLLVMDVPAAGIWAVLVLILTIVQLPPLVVLGPIIYVFSVSPTGPAIVFMIWSLLVSMSDAFLKPLFLGRGMDIPMLVILLGAIGGMMMSGILGLFIGSVVLALGYKLFMIWLDPANAAKGSETPEET